MTTMFVRNAALAAALFLTPVAASAQDLITYGSAGPWDILIDKTIGHGCFIQSEFEDGSLVRIGIDKTRGVGYVTAFNEAWGDVVEGQVYPITFDLDGNSYDGQAKGIYLEGIPGADIEFDNEDFFWDIMKKYVMTLYHDGEEVMAISLDGTFVALDAVLQCQAEVDANR